MASSQMSLYLLRPASRPSGTTRSGDDTFLHHHPLAVTLHHLERVLASRSLHELQTIAREVLDFIQPQQQNGLAHSSGTIVDVHQDSMLPAAPAEKCLELSQLRTSATPRPVLAPSL